MRLKLSELEQDYGQVIKVARRRYFLSYCLKPYVNCIVSSGNWDEPEQVVMRSSGVNQVYNR